MTIHAGLLIEHLPKVKGRITGIVNEVAASWPSGCSITTVRIRCTRALTTSARSSSVTAFLEFIAPGCQHDASDAAQLAELPSVKAVEQEHDVQVMVEGPGHVDQIEFV